MLVDEAGRLEAAVEAGGDPRGPVGVAREQHDRRVVTGLGMQVDLWHARSLRIPGCGRHLRVG